MQITSENSDIRKSYPQNWSSYNASQVSEKHYFMELLKELAFKIRDPEPQTKGRPRISLGEVVFAVCLKSYCTLSGRRVMTDLRYATEKGYLSKTPHFNSLYNYLDNPKLTNILKELITFTSLPFAAVEQDFAVDSSGFTTATYTRWYDHKYGQKPRGEWVKAHIMCGVKTHTITAVEIWDRHTHDTKPFPYLLHTTAQNFAIKEVSGDKAYCSIANHDFVEDVGATPFFAFKINSKINSDPGMWTKMFHYFHLNQEDFLRHYHKRSNVETTFSMVKAKFGGSVRSKTETARINECLCKLLCHNICVFIKEMHELGIDIRFNKSPFAS